jgi:hypothetical protein
MAEGTRPARIAVEIGDGGRFTYQTQA